MENGGIVKGWNFKPNSVLESAAQLTIRGVLISVMSNLDPRDARPTIPLGHGGRSVFPCFRATPVFEDAIVSAVRSGQYNSYSPNVGILPFISSHSNFAEGNLPIKLQQGLNPPLLGSAVGCINWIRITFAIEPSLLEESLGRLKSFCQKHAKKQ